MGNETPQWHFYVLMHILKCKTFTKRRISNEIRDYLTNPLEVTVDILLAVSPSKICAHKYVPSIIKIQVCVLFHTISADYNY